jgi:hypothetical protein
MMGGNALKNCTTRRFEKAEFERMQKRVIDTLRNEFEDAYIQPIVAYADKDSFGDLDVLIQVGSKVFVEREEIIKRLFNSKEIVKNGNVWSFEFEELQVDLIFTSAGEFESSNVYFAYNDLGNLMGRIAHKLGFKYGHAGLSFVMRDDDHEFKDIVVSNNMYSIFDFLGYDKTRWDKGFKTKEDIFRFVITSKYFNKKIFLLDNRNHKSRIRDAKRATYMEFLKWLETTDTPMPAYEWPSMEERGGRKETPETMEYAFKLFPGFRDAYNSSVAEYKRHQEFKGFFNGELVMEWTGLTGKELGRFMLQFKTMFETTGVNMTDWVISNGKIHPRVIETVVVNKALEWDFNMVGV